jgi:Tfp pilus assembly protein PilF
VKTWKRKMREAGGLPYPTSPRLSEQPRPRAVPSSGQSTTGTAQSSKRARHARLCARRQGRSRRAAAEYLEAFRLDPSSADGHAHLAGTLERKGDDQSALEGYRKALELDPKNPDIRSAYARLREKLKR